MLKVVGLNEHIHIHIHGAKSSLSYCAQIGSKKVDRDIHKKTCNHTTYVHHPIDQWPKLSKGGSTRIKVHSTGEKKCMTDC